MRYPDKPVGPEEHSATKPDANEVKALALPAKPPAGTPNKADPGTTGSIRAQPRRAAR
jgi:hypothetical protein